MGLIWRVWVGTITLEELFLKKINFVGFWMVVSTFTKGRDRGKNIFLRFYAGYHVFSIMFKIAWEVLFYSKRKVRTISCRMSLVGGFYDKNSNMWFYLKSDESCYFQYFSGTFCEINVPQLVTVEVQKIFIATCNSCQDKIIFYRPLRLIM